MNHLLFRAADFLSRLPGSYGMVVAMVACTAVVQGSSMRNRMRSSRN
ncbi:hypothetical protein [Mesorhizobium sp. B2-4-6]|nr:hypothetical protein [Mesorhizobium sp. B2-4-6]